MKEISPCMGNAILRLGSDLMKMEEAKQDAMERILMLPNSEEKDGLWQSAVEINTGLEHFRSARGKFYR